MSMWSNGIRTAHRPDAEQALKSAIVTSRRSPGAALREQRSGRIDRRRLSRVALADNRVFVAKRAPRPMRVRVTILVDASSSMRGLPSYTEEARRVGLQTIAIAAQTCRDLAGATEMLDWVTASAMAFTTGQGGVIMAPLWQSGKPTEDIEKRLNRLHMGGTEEGYALASAGDDLRETRKPGEQALIIILSDGGPSEPAHVKWVVDRLADDDIPVVSVALTDSAEQPLMYGKSNVIKYTNNPRKLARDMAKVIGRVL